MIFDDYDRFSTVGFPVYQADYRMSTEYAFPVNLSTFWGCLWDDLGGNRYLLRNYLPISI